MEGEKEQVSHLLPQFDLTYLIPGIARLDEESCNDKIKPFQSDCAKSSLQEFSEILKEEGGKTTNLLLELQRSLEKTENKIVCGNVCEDDKEKEFFSEKNDDQPFFDGPSTLSILNSH
ncbi:uncharacterized protein MONOS_17089 [Monocercomonoides exilis]|uniref:uncharacterized protein n=1 Tax=Monocercomonoides exilis TaxID=2049356 RepID=UPI003559B911|nr:hypothetical protein MONOS_17089 [Monocercomonoides exilis]